MSEIQSYPVPDGWADRAWINKTNYQKMYRESVEKPDSFWARQATEFLLWDSPWTTVSSYDFAKAEAEWFKDGKLNVTTNCIDRHLQDRAEQTATIWEGDDPSEDKNINYQELHDQVSKMGNVLRQRGVEKGDRVCIYVPMIPEAAYAMLACARVGVVHSVIFGGFSPDAIVDRCEDAEAKLIITADAGYRRGDPSPLKVNVDAALASGAPTVQNVVVVDRCNTPVEMQEGRDHWWHNLMMNVSTNCPAEPMPAEQLLYLLYTSGTTAKPKGIMHTSGGYLTQVAFTHKH